VRANGSRWRMRHRHTNVWHSRCGCKRSTPTCRPMRMLSYSSASALRLCSRQCSPTTGSYMTCHPLRLSGSTTTCFQAERTGRSVQQVNLPAVARARCEGKEGVTTCLPCPLKGANPEFMRLGAGDGTRTRDALLGRQAGVLAPRNNYSRLMPDHLGSGFSRVGAQPVRQAH
jgi:hypothetical protein